MEPNRVSSKLWDHIKGMVYGQCIGDAVGLATEFLSQTQVAYVYPRAFADRTYTHADRMDNSHSERWQEADFTDDSDQMLLILDSLLANDMTATPSDFLDRLCEWTQFGFRDTTKTLQVKRPMGIGHTINRVTRRHLGGDVHAARSVWEMSGRKLAANGAVMRTAITAVPHFMDTGSVVADTVAIARTTHYDPRAIASCVAVAVAVASILQRAASTDEVSADACFVDEILDKGVVAAVEWMRAQDRTLEVPESEVADDNDDPAFARFMFDAAEADLKRLHGHGVGAPCSFEDLQLDDPDALGFTFKCSGAAFAALRALPTKGFVDTMCDLVAQGGDADTNGAVAGALMGCVLGYTELVAQVKHLNWHVLNHEDDVLLPRLEALSRCELGKM